MSVLGEGFRTGSAPPSRNRPHGNLTVLRVAVLALFGLLTARLVSMQIIDGSSYARQSHENHIRSENILPSRGLIYGRDGTPLVQNVGVYTATITPEFLPPLEKDRYQIYLKLESLVRVPAAEIQAMVKEAEKNKDTETPLPVKTYLSKDEALMLDEASTDMPGVKLNVKPGRLYVAGQGFSHILGYIGDQAPDEVKELQRKGYQRNEPVGKSGIEARYEDDLRGKTGISAVEQDAQGNLINTLETHDPVAGNSLKLAIDPGLQDYVQQLLEDTRQEANVAAAVVMSPKTGEVYALVSLPTYDSNIFSQMGTRGAEYTALVNDPRKPFLDWSLSASAPGSTFKLVTAAAGLQEGNITPNTGFNVKALDLEFKGENGVIYYLHDWRVHGYINLYGAIEWSSNQYFYMTSCGIPQDGIKGLGKDVEDSAYKLANYARIFGLGQPTGIDVGDEAWGNVPTPAWKAKAHSGPGFDKNDQQWYLSDTCFMGIGQGDVTATPLQIARMTAAVANGGKLLTPHVVNEIVSPEGKTLRTIAPDSKELPLDRANLAVIRQGMHLSVLEGAGARAYTPGIDIAGKTGTAEFTDPKTGKTLQHAWFTGFAPFNDPQVVVTVYYDLGVGGDKAAPTAGKIFDYFMKNVKP